jgi:opacity protein-like surface antigen
MRRCTALVTGWFGAVALAVHAQAADMPRFPLPDMDKPPLIGTEFVSGWYLRGDLGYRHNHIGSVEATVPVTSANYHNTLALGMGVGYKWKWLRADVTLDYGMRGRVAADTALGQNFYQAKVDALTTLGNLYLDLGTWNGFTPYVGVGAGASRLNTNEFTTAGVVSSTRAQEIWQFSWAWMAGASFQFTPNLALDVGYRFLHLGDAMTPPDATGSAVTFKNISAQEIRVGFRLLLD